MTSLNARTADAYSFKVRTIGDLELSLANAMSDFCEGGEGDRVTARDHRDEGFRAADDAQRLPEDDRWALVEFVTDAAGPFAGPVVYAAAELRMAEHALEASRQAVAAKAALFLSGVAA